MKFYSPTLNPQQKIAIEHFEGPMLVLAGAGSGKTHVVTCRIAQLLQLGILASEILALTFTNKAADEMRLRIQNMSNQDVLISTFHSLGARILRESISSIGYSSDFTIYDEEDSLRLIKLCLVSLGQREDKGLIKSLKSAISKGKNRLLVPDDPSFSEVFPQKTLFKEVFSLYQKKLKEYNGVDFDDLLFLTVKLFRSSEETVQRYQKKWPYVLIDEYQDTNHAQYLLTKFLVGECSNLFAVGDPDQSIYSWRGANIRNILDFERDFPGAQVLTLEQNYRSSNTILDAANALITHNERRHEKKLWSALGAGEKIKVYLAKNENEEARFVVQQLVKQTDRENIPLCDSVIFYRTNAQSRPFEDALRSHNIPYIIVGGISFYERREIKDLLAWLRISVLETDFLSFARTINLPRKGIGPATLEKWRTLAEEREMPILALCRQLLIGQEPEICKLSKKQKESLKEYLTIIEQLQNLVDQQAPLQELLQEALSLSNYIEVLKQDPETLKDRKENLEALINKAVEFSIEKKAPTLIQFLEELTLTSSFDEIFSHKAVRLMTLHNGKGLEFSLTFIVGMEENLFPYISSKDAIDALEEERRLCYVGITRARRWLYLTSSIYRLIWGTPQLMQPSRFIQEIPRHLLHFLSPMYKEEETKTLQVGTVVAHKDFGKGIIKKAYHTSLGVTYDVHFFHPRCSHSLLQKYARLRILG